MTIQSPRPRRKEPSELAGATGGEAPRPNLSEVWHVAVVQNGGVLHLTYHHEHSARQRIRYAPEFGETVLGLWRGAITWHPTN